MDSSGKVLPSNLPYSEIARRIAPIGELIFFEYGVVVMWGLTEDEERLVLKLIKSFEEEKILEEDVEIEELHFHYNIYAQPRFYL